MRFASKTFTRVAMLAAVCFTAATGCKSTISGGLSSAIDSTLPHARQDVLPAISDWNHVAIPEPATVPTDRESTLSPAQGANSLADPAKEADAQIESIRKLIRARGGERALEDTDAYPIPTMPATTADAPDPALEQLKSQLSSLLDREKRHPIARARVLFLLSDLDCQGARFGDTEMHIQDGRDGLILASREDLLGALYEIRLHCLQNKHVDLKSELAKVQQSLWYLLNRPGITSDEAAQDTECQAFLECVAARIALQTEGVAGVSQASDRFRQAVMLYRQHSDAIGEYWALRDIAAAYHLGRRDSSEGMAVLLALKVAPPDCLKYDGEKLLERAKSLSAQLKQSGQAAKVELAKQIDERSTVVAPSLHASPAMQTTGPAVTSQGTPPP